MTGDIVKRSVEVIKHPRKKEWAVVYFTKYGEGRYAMNKNTATSRWYGHSRNKAYELAKKLRR
jgi:hypothetical protein